MSTHVLVVNDDGVEAQGLRELLAALSEARIGTTVIAPDGNRSAMGHAVTCKAPVRLERRDDEFDATVYACSGTPVDCARIGLLADLGPRPTMLVSGINHGINLGDDMTYSGTVAAAVEAALLGYTGIAFSQQNEDGGVPFIESSSYGFDLAWFAADLVATIDRMPPPGRTAISVNLPCRLKNSKVAVVRPGRRFFERGSLDPQVDGDGRLIFHPYGTIDDPEPVYETGAGADFAALLAGRVSLTAVSRAPGDPEHQARVNAWAAGLDLRVPEHEVHVTPRSEHE